MYIVRVTKAMASRTPGLPQNRKATAVTTVGKQPIELVGQVPATAYGRGTRTHPSLSCTALCSHVLLIDEPQDSITCQGEHTSINQVYVNVRCIAVKIYFHLPVVVHLR